MVYVRIKALPPDSAMAIHSNGGKRPWTIAEYLLADLWEAQVNRGLKRGRTPRRHPARPQPRKRARTAEQQRKHDEAMRRHRRRYKQHYNP
jgi:hypothetical protein